MSMWYDFDGVLILKVMACPAFTLIDVAKPWIVESPAPLTCQSLGGSPGNVFSHAITLVTGGPHGPAALAGCVLTRDRTPRSTASMRPITKRGVRIRERVADIPDPPHRQMTPYFNVRKVDAEVIHGGWQKIGYEMVT